MVPTIVFRRKIPVLLARLPPKLSVELDFWTFLLCSMIVQQKKPEPLEKPQVCRGYRPENGYFYRFLKENLSSLSSPATRTECGA
jgi:hypothetical protein